MDDNAYKEVRFDEYCPTCKYSNQAENEKPCDKCLEEPVNLYSHKPTEWMEKK